MIHKKLLNKWEETLKVAITGTFPADDARELIRLARFGLWAESFGISALRQDCCCYADLCRGHKQVTEAIAELPREE